jgi:hypothetical protein
MKYFKMLNNLPIKFFKKLINITNSSYKKEKVSCKHQSLDYWDVTDIKSDIIYCKDCCLYTSKDFFKKNKEIK